MNISAQQTMLNSASSSSSYASGKPISLSDLMQQFYTSIQNLKTCHENDIEKLNQRICELETQNRQLLDQLQPHSVFDINHVPENEQLKHELEQARATISVLQSKVDQQYDEYQDMMSKHTLRHLINNDNNKNETSNSNVIELESKLKQIKDQLNQFEQCHYESDEQIRLLKQLVSTNDSEQNNTITQSLTVKQTDLQQQTDIVTNILNKQHEKILEKLANLLEQNSQTDFPPKSMTTTKKLKKKRL